MGDLRNIVTRLRHLVDVHGSVQPSLGNILVGDGSFWQLLSPGADDEVLTSIAGDIDWAPSVTGAQAVGAYTPTKIHAPRPSSTIADISGTHGWTSVIPAAGGTVTDDTDEFILSEQSIKVVTSGNSGTFFLDKTLGSAVDMTGKKFVLWVRTDGEHPNLFWFNMLAGSGGSLAAFYEWSAISNAGNQYVKPGEWVGVVFSFSDATVSGSPDRTALNRFRIKLADNNQGTPVTYWFGGIQTVDDNADFPNGVLTFSFDDGAITQFTNARPKLNEYGFPATAYVVQALAEAAGASNMSTDQLHVLDRLGWDIAGHAYSSDANSNGMGDWTDAQVAAELRQLRQWLLQEGFRGADHFAYPLGETSLAIEERVRQFFATARFTRGGMEHVAPSLSTRIRARNVTAADSVATITDLIDDAFANNDWLVLIFHRIVDSGASDNDVLTADFGSIVDYANTKGIPVKTVSEVAATVRA